MFLSSISSPGVPLACSSECTILSSFDFSSAGIQYLRMRETFIREYDIWVQFKPAVMFDDKLLKLLPNAVSTSV